MRIETSTFMAAATKNGSFSGCYTHGCVVRSFIFLSISSCHPPAAVVNFVYGRSGIFWHFRYESILLYHALYLMSSSCFLFFQIILGSCRLRRGLFCFSQHRRFTENFSHFPPKRVWQPTLQYVTIWLQLSIMCIVTIFWFYFYRRNNHGIRNSRPVL